MQTKILLSLLLLFSFAQAKKSDSLATLCEYGLKNNPKIKSFHHRVTASNSFYEQSIDQYKPHLDISGQYGIQNYHYEYPDRNVPYNGRSFNFTVQLKQPLYRAELLHSMDDAKAKQLLTRLQEDDEQAKLITQILHSAVELIRQKKIIAVLQKKKDLLNKAYETILSRYDAKAATSSEKYQSLAMLEQSKSELIKAKQRYDYNLYNLRMLTKYNNVEKYIAPLSYNIPAVSKAFKKTNLSKLRESIHNNTRIKLDRQSVKIAKIQIALRRSASRPKLDAVVSYGDAGGSIDYVTRRNDSRAAIQLSFPLYQGGYVDDRVKEAKFLYFAAKEDMQETRLNIKISMEKVLQDIKGGLASIHAQRSAVDSSQKYFKGTIDAYKNGMQSLTDVYLAESDYHDNKLRLINSEADLVASLVESFYYSGKMDIKQIRKMQHTFFK